jgi:NADH-quinone oxidoreductase subunit C
LPDAPGLELISQEINDAHPGTVTETAFDHGRATLVVAPDNVTHALRWLRDTDGQEYRFLSSLHAADYLPGTPRFAVHYELLCRDRVERIHVKALLADPAAGRSDWSELTAAAASAFPTSAAQPHTPAGEAEEVGADLDGEPLNPDGLLPELDSCVELFPTADFQEREAYDFFGIVFRNHPDLRRITMPADYVGWPQRRDFPVGGEPVLFTHNEIALPRWYE